MRYVIGYQTKWSHHNNFDDAVAIVEIEATDPTGAIGNFQRLIRLTFGKTLTAHIVSIGIADWDVPENDPRRADAFYALASKQAALEQEVYERLVNAVAARELRWNVQYDDLEGLRVTSMNDNGNVVYCGPRPEGCRQFCLHHLTQDNTKDAVDLAKAADFEWTGNINEDGKRWVQRIIQHIPAIYNALATPPQTA